jgi:hypothetical protein
VNINGASGNLAGSVTYVGSHSKVVFTFQAVRTSTGANAVMQQSSEQSSLGPQYWDCAGTPRNAPCNMLGTSTYAVNVGLPVPCDVTLEASGTYRAWFTWLIPLPVPGGWDWGVLTWGETDPEAGPTSQKNSGTCTPPTARVKVETTSSPYSWAGNNGSLVITAVGTSGYVRADATTSTKGSLDIASFKWSVDGTEVSTAAVAPIEVPLGTHSVSLTVTDTDGKTSTASASVTVKKPVRRVSVSLGSPAIAIGSGLYASASAYDEDNNSVPGGCVFSWWSSNGSVAAVDASGFVAGIGAGSATIYAQCEGVTGFAELSVVSCNGGGGGGGGGETYVVGATINPCGVPGGGGGGGGGGWQTVCVEYEVGYYYPDTGERVVLAEWTECYQIAAQLVTSAFGGAPRKKVSLIASGRTSDAAATRVIRRMAGDFIVIDTTRATARDLATSIAALQTLRSSGTPSPENGDMAVGSDLVTASNWESTTGRDLDVTLKVLRLMPIREVEGFGPRRSTSLQIQDINVARKQNR